MLAFCNVTFAAIIDFLVDANTPLWYKIAMIEQEIWKPIDFTNGHYEVSSLGRIKRAKPGQQTWVGRILKTSKSRTRKFPYRTVSLSYDGHYVCKGVHVLVCSAFHGPKPKGCQVGHKDDNPENNRADNLEWITPSQNMKQAFDRKRKFSPGSIPEFHAKAMKTRKQKLKDHPELRPVGEKNSFAKYSNMLVAEVKQFRIDHPEFSIREIAKQKSIEKNVLKEVDKQ